jgi:ferrous iron transport protein B
MAVSELRIQDSKLNIAVPLRRIALAGNPNAGKTTLFNALTGMRQKVGNYPGVTVEKKEGRCLLVAGREVLILDLPGTYSLSPKSPDEEIARDVLLGLRSDTPRPDAVVVVVDASNLERNLYLATQVLELGLPTVVVLNMTDVAESAGKRVDAHQLALDLGAPVVPIVAVRGEGIPLLKATLLKEIPTPVPPSLELSDHLDAARNQLALALNRDNNFPLCEILPAGEPTDESDETPAGEVLPRDPANAGARGVALRLLCSDVPARTVGEVFNSVAAGSLAEMRADKDLSPLPASATEAQARYALLGKIVSRAVHQTAGELPKSFTDRADAILTHKFWGLGIFALITLLVFQAIFSWASLPMDWIDGSVGALGDWARGVLPPGALADLIVEGVIKGVGAVLIFLPQILILFFFIGLLEDTGYMARAAFIMDRLMSKVGLHGRAFIPLMSSFACAIPGIMATRTIASRRDRMTTILIAPLMACSARLPVYALMIAAFIPNAKVWGVLSLRATTLFALYAGGVLVAMAAAWVFKKTIFAGPPPVLMMELPPYKIPSWKNIVFTMWDRGSQFLYRAGTVILAISIVLWFMLTYPRVDAQSVVPADGIEPGPGRAALVIQKAPAGEAAGENVEDALAARRLENSIAGRVGRLVEPTIAPLGFNWKIGVGLIGAMAAREVFVSTMGTVYAVGEADETSQSLKEQMRGDKWPDGRPVWTTLTAISLMVYFVIAMQCVSTLAVVKRETNSWKWPIFMQVYLTALAWLASLAVYEIGRAWGY